MAHMWHGALPVAELCGKCAVRLKIAGTSSRLFPVVHVSKLKRVRVFPDLPANILRVTEAYRVDYNDAILPEYRWMKTELGDIESEVERTADMRSDRKTRF